MRAVAHVGECTSDAIATHTRGTATSGKSAGPRPAGTIAHVFRTLGVRLHHRAGRARSCYFHRNALHELDFDALQPGLPVEVEIERGTRGPQASRVFPVGERMAT